jgi:hypothetical protein
MLPLSIIRGTSEVIRAQRTSEFNAFLAAAISVPKLRMLPSLVLLLAPDDIGSQRTVYVPYISKHANDVKEPKTLDVWPIAICEHILSCIVSSGLPLNTLRCLMLRFFMAQLAL